jgi:HSP20 family protein
VDPEGVTATLKEGVLSLTVPKKPEVQPKRITVGSQAAGPSGAPDKGKARA